MSHPKEFDSVFDSVVLPKDLTGEKLLENIQHECAILREVQMMIDAQNGGDRKC